MILSSFSYVIVHKNVESIKCYNRLRRTRKDRMSRSAIEGLVGL